MPKNLAYSDVLKGLKAGKAYRRSGWPPSYSFSLQFGAISAAKYQQVSSLDYLGVPLSLFEVYESDIVTRLPISYLNHGSSLKLQYTPSIDDQLAEDWIQVEKTK